MTVKIESRYFWLSAILLVLGVTAVLYWPVHKAGFVWDDLTDFQDYAWLRHGDAWRSYIFRNFNDWINYFRPLGVALFVAEVRAFDVNAGSMHLVSLCLHLINTLLVALLALRLCPDPDDRTSRILIVMATFLYALHPALIEPVVWIGCQFDLLTTLFMLLGLLINDTVRTTWMRALGVGLCFLLAASAKESAVCFPLLLALFDWMRPNSADQPEPIPFWARARSVVRRQFPVYASVVIVGILYLCLRFWALGHMMTAQQLQPTASAAWFQMVSYTYMTCWKILTLPMLDLGPVHTVDPTLFQHVSLRLLASDLAAPSLVLVGLYAAWKRHPIGASITAATISLLPVIHLVPTTFDESLYHERYVMTAAAVICAYLPRTLRSFGAVWREYRLITYASAAVAALWLAAAIVNIRVTVPLWSNDEKLWLWVLREHPDNIYAMNNLLTNYMTQHDVGRAQALAERMFERKPKCPVCMINIANVALGTENVTRASEALKLAGETTLTQQNARLMQSYFLATGQLLELRGDREAAEEIYRKAIRMQPLDPHAQIYLAILLARENKFDEARVHANKAIALFAPTERQYWRTAFDQTIAAAEHSQKQISDPPSQ